MGWTRWTWNSSRLLCRSRCLLLAAAAAATWITCCAKNADVANARLTLWHHHHHWKEGMALSSILFLFLISAPSAIDYGSGSRSYPTRRRECHGWFWRPDPTRTISSLIAAGHNLQVSHSSHSSTKTKATMSPVFPLFLPLLFLFIS